LGKKVYDYEIDKTICKSLLEYESNNISRRKLKRIIEGGNYLGRKLGTRLYEFHIRRLLEARYIFEKKDEWIRGKKSPLLLSNKTREQLRLDNLNIEFKEDHPNLLNSYKKLKKQRMSKEDRFKSELKRNRIYYIIMRALSIETPNRFYKYPGLSISDIINARYDGHAFYFLRLEDDKELVQECLNSLIRERIVSEIKIPSEDVTRYKLVDLRWKSFVTDCSHLLEDTITMELHLKWQNLRRPRPLERIYYESCWGDRSANGHLIRVYQNYQGNEEKSSDRYRQEIEDLLYDIDCNLHQEFKYLESKYRDLGNKCSSVYNMIVETIYPKFLRLEIERTVNNPKNKGRKYHTMQSARFDDSIIFGGSIQTDVRG
jgi:hypothetical protein